MENILYGICWALNVGQMVFEFENRVETNTNAKEMKVYTYENIEISKGECLGYFQNGSHSC